jgi:non-haem Fe2+, alpha-ketoglutarate-dependent halogenase
MSGHHVPKAGSKSDYEAPANVNAELRAAYNRDGYLFPLNIFNQYEAARWASEISNLPTAELKAQPAPWNQDAHFLLPSLDGLIRDSRLTDPIAAILGDDLLVVSATLFIKPPKSSKIITWHQDLHYWSLKPAEVLTAWVALTPATLDTGCLKYIAGTHKFPIEHIEVKTEDNILSKGQVIPNLDESAAVDVILSPGQVAFHDGLTPHASGQNDSDGIRIGFGVIYVSPFVRQTGGPRLPARLVRGTDKYGHFEIFEGPDAPLSPQAIASHARALAPHAPFNYSTA